MLVTIVRLQFLKIQKLPHKTQRFPQNPKSKKNVWYIFLYSFNHYLIALLVPIIMLQFLKLKKQKWERLKKKPKSRKYAPNPYLIAFFIPILRLEFSKIQRLPKKLKKISTNNKKSKKYVPKQVFQKFLTPDHFWSCIIGSNNESTIFNNSKMTLTKLKKESQKPGSWDNVSSFFISSPRLSFVFFCKIY